MEAESQKIVLEEVIRSKNPKLLKILPGFVLNYIKKIIHQEEFNQLLLETKDKYKLDFVDEALKHFQINVECKGLENIPEKGGCIVVCNHPLGGIDGIAVMNQVGKVRGDMKALVNDLLLNLQNLKELLIPINKLGKNAIQNIRQIDKTYASDECVIVFPAGLVSRKQKGKIQDLEWKKSFVVKAVQYQHDVIPIHVEAQNSNFFYNVASFRKKMRIKTNIEMFYLVDEVYKQRGKTIKLTVGKPISYSVFDKTKTPQVWANEIRNRVYQLKGGSIM